MDVLAPLGERPRGRGPVEAAFAAYLSSRVDLLTQAEALDLLVKAEPVSAAPCGDVQGRFFAEIGCSLEDAFASFEVEPFDSDLLFQWHRARLGNGEPVVVKVVRPELDERLEADLDRLSALEPSPGRRRRLKESRAVVDFKGFLDRSLDLCREAEDLIALRERCEGMSLITIPEVHLELSGERFLTLADLEGAPLAERGTAPRRLSETGAPRWARRLCRAWLRLALSADTVPVNPCGRNVLLLDDGKVAFCGGPFEPLSGRSRDQLRSYLAATAIEDHESLADALLELAYPGSRRDERHLRHELRHTAPFRDGGWNTDSDSLARSLLAHWHQAATFGFRPRRPLLAFLRGLALLTREAYILAPGESSFREAFQEFRLYQLFAESTRFATGDEVGPITDLPRRLDRGLTLAGHESRPLAEKTREGRAGSWSAVVALLLALAAIVLLVHHIAPPSGEPDWIERLGAVAVLVLGGLLLRFAAD